MSTADFIIADTKNGSRVHRATCKRAKNPVPLADATPEQADGVVPASCCKPDAERVAVALLALSGQREAEHLAEQVTAEPAGDGEVTVTVAYEDCPKGLFKPLATDAAERLAEATGVAVTVDRAARTVELFGQPEHVEKAEQVVRQWWDWAYAAFREWKRTDEYRALDKKGLWSREQEWIAALDVEAVAR